MKTRLSRFLPIIIALIFFATLYAGLQRDPQRITVQYNRNAIPTISLEDLHQPEQLISTESLKGESFLLHIWASWCSVCLRESPFLRKLSEQPELTLYGLNYRDSRQAALAALNKHGNPYQKTLFDPEGTLTLALGAYGTPSTYLFDHQGIIQFHYIGELDLAVWEQEFIPRIKQLRNTTTEEK